MDLSKYLLLNFEAKIDKTVFFFHLQFFNSKENSIIMAKRSRQHSSTMNPNQPAADGMPTHPELARINDSNCVSRCLRFHIWMLLSRTEIKEFYFVLD